MVEIIKENSNSYRFCLKSISGGTLLNSVPFKNEQEIEETLATLNDDFGRHLLFERKTDHNGKFLFNVKNKDGALIGQSNLYSSEAGMENGIKNLKNSISKADIS